jgi:beta-glucosidase
VVQLYIGARAASVTRPVRELKGFQKVRIKPGQTVDVDFTLSRADLTFIGQDLQPTVESGSFDLWVGPSATQGLKSTFVLAPEPELE